MCVRACVRVCVLACVCACMCTFSYVGGPRDWLSCVSLCEDDRHVIESGNSGVILMSLALKGMLSLLVVL